MGMDIAAGVSLGILVGTLFGVSISVYRHRRMVQRGHVSTRLNDILTGTLMAVGAIGGGLVAAPI